MIVPNWVGCALAGGMLCSRVVFGVLPKNPVEFWIPMPAAFPYVSASMEYDC